jgi:hypothetical protein
MGVKSQNHLFSTNMKLRIHKHAVAWLGLMAMLLAVFAPLMSHLIASARADEPVGFFCSTVKNESPSGTHSVSKDQLDACGYCNFFAHHVPATIAAPPQLLANAVLVIAQVSAPAVFIPYATFPSGRPRDPPVIS